MAATLLTTTVKSVAGTGSGVARAVDKLPPARTNVGSTERWLSVAAGGALAGLCLTGRVNAVLGTLAGTYLIYRGVTGNCPARQALGLSTSDATAPNSVITAGHGTRVQHAVTVNRSAQEAYRFWRDLENLPRFMTHLIDVNTSTDGTSHWVAKGPFGLRVEWEAQIITDTPNRAISWKSLDGADVDNTGSVHFVELPGGRGTEVRVELKYDPPAGKLGTAIASLIGRSPQQQIEADMQRFKQILEAGSVPTTEGQSSGRR